MKTRFFSIILAAVLLGTGCRPATEPARVSLPAGDPARGKAAFTSMNCFACHTVVGHNFPAPYAQPAVPVALGAEATRPTRTQLVDSIVNPSHAIEAGYKEELVRSARLSRMGDYSEVMTVRQLSDLVAFLESLPRTK